MTTCVSLKKEVECSICISYKISFTESPYLLSWLYMLRTFKLLLYI